MKSTYLALFNLHLSTGILQIFIYFLSPPISISIIINALSLIFGVVTMKFLSKDFEYSIWLFPHSWFLVSIGYLFFLVPLIHVGNPNYTDRLFPGFDWSKNLGEAVTISGIFINFLFATSISRFHRFHKRKKSINAESFEINWLVCVLVIAYSVFGFAFWLFNSGGLPALFLTRYSFSQSGLQYQNGYLYASLNFGIGAILVLILKGLFDSNKRLIYISYLLILIFMLPDLLRGTRVNSLFSLVCIFGVYGHYRHKIGNTKVFSRLKAILILFLIPAIIIAPRLYRNENKISALSFAQAFSGKNLFDSLAGHDSAMDLGLSIFLQAKLDLAYGVTYLEALFRPIPRALWPDKPYEIDKNLNAMIFPKTSTHVGFSFSGFSEPLYNFGIFGVVFFAIILGWLSSSVFSRASMGNIRSVLLCVFFCAFSFNLLRGNFSSSYSQLLFPLVAGYVTLKTRPLSSEHNET